MRYDIQKASLLKRIPAWILDAILLVTVATGMIACLAYAVDLDSYNQELSSVYTKYEETYGIDFGITEEEFMALQANDPEQFAKYQEAQTALSKDMDAQKKFEAFLNMILLTFSLGILLAHLVLEFAIPLWLKNGQTLGKKCFGIALMRKDGIKVTPFMMFARSILGKYTIETMIPFLLIMAIFFNIMGAGAALICLLFLIVQVIVTLATRNKTALHDIMACTIAVDMNSQMIFETVEEMDAYNEEIRRRVDGTYSDTGTEVAQYSED